MTAIAISLGIGLLGVLASRAGLGYVAREAPGGDPHLPWTIGLLGLLPGWLVAFLALLGSSPEPRLPVWSAAAWIASAAAALIGTIVTEAIVRGASESGGRPPATYWGLGLVTLAPAWLISILGNLGR